MILSSRNTDTCKLFVEYAQEDVTRWQEIVGQIAVYNSPDRGIGMIVAVDNSLGYVTITLDYNDGRHTVRGRTFCKHHSNLSLSKEFQERI